MLCAYDRGYRKNKTVSEWSRWGTLASAIVATLSPAASWPPLTVISGALAALLAAVEQSYSPTKSSQAFWECRTRLEGIKRDIVSCAIAMDIASDLASGMEPLNQISRRIGEGAKVPFEVISTDKEEAQQAFKGSVIAGMIARYEHGPEPDEEMPSSLGFDAPDVVMVARPTAFSSGA